MKVKTDICWDGLHDMVKNLNRLEDREVAVGYGGGLHDDSGLTVGELAIITEKGVRRDNGGSTPPRPFMALAKNILAESITPLSVNVVKNTLLDKNSIVTRDLHKIGDLGTESIQMAIDTQEFAALKPETVKIKKQQGSRFADQIILDTGELYQSIEVKVK